MDDIYDLLSKAKRKMEESDRNAIEFFQAVLEKNPDNVEALLKEAECTFEDVAQIIVYLRDSSDYTVVSKLFEERFPDKPYIIVLASVCRPSWLIEMECIAIKKTNNDSFECF